MKGWLDRHPLLLAALTSVGFLGVCQALFLVLWNRTFISPGMALGLTRMSLAVAAITLLLLLPAIVLLRWALPSWRAGDRLRATWSVCFGPVVALSVFMIAVMLVPGWAAILVGGAVGLLAAGLHPSAAWLRAAALGTLAAVLLIFIPWPGSTGPPPPAPETPPASKAKADAKRPDVVLVSIDTLRTDHLGAYGRAPSITPAMDRIAREGVVIERGLSASPWTLPSVASMMTALPITRHGAGMPLGSGMTFRRSGLEGRFTTLAEHFAAAGYRTRAVVANSFVGGQFGLAQGFQEFDNPFERGMGAGFMRDLPLGRLIVSLRPPEKWGDYRASGLTDTALRWLGETHDEPLFLWVHYVDPHVPYQSDPERIDPEILAEMMHEGYPKTLEDGTVVGDVFVATGLVRSGMLWLGPMDRQRLQDYYAREVAYMDRHIGRLFEALRARSSTRRVVAALTTDHGEEFWDHGRFEHGHDYYREVTWVPILVWGPETVPAGRRVDAVAGLVDVAPTLLDLAGLTPPAAAAPDEGRSLAGHWSGSGLAAAPRFCGGNLYGLPAVAVADGTWKLVLRGNGAQELYDVAKDPQERRNLAYERPEIAARYRPVLETQLAALTHTSDSGKARELTPEQLEALKALGYVQ